MIPMFPTAAIPTATLPAPALISIDPTALVALGGVVLVGLLAAAAVRLIRRPGRQTRIDLTAAPHAQRAA